MNENLIKILGNARNVMGKVESGDYSKGNVDASYLQQVDGTKLDNSKAVTATPVNSRLNHKYLAEGEGPPGVAAKNMPKEILELMKAKPIPQGKLPSTGFSLEDVAPLVINKSKPLEDLHKMNESVNSILSEKNKNSDLILISKSELKNTINEALLSFMTNYREATIKETITALIKEGKLNVVKKRG